MTKIAGSGSESGSTPKCHGSADPDPDPPQNVMDPQHWLLPGFRIRIDLMRIRIRNQHFFYLRIRIQDLNPGSGSRV
jgi:hypothetical protein